MSDKEILLANPRGFCAGVERAIEIVERALQRFGAPIYVRHEVVHNKFVVDDLRNKGAIFVEELDEVPTGNTVIFSAHGVSLAVREEAEKRGLRVFDATCPLVTKVHIEVEPHARAGPRDHHDRPQGPPRGRGHYGPGQDRHPSGRDPGRRRHAAGRQSGSAGLCHADHAVGGRCGKHRERLRARFPNIAGPKKDDICYATQNRQDAVKFMTPHADVVFVVGSKNSSNSNRLREVAELRGVPAYLVDNAAGIDPAWVEGKRRVGVTAGASAPEVLVEEVIARLKELSGGSVRNLDGVPEKVTFPLPKELQDVR
ncbi:4-hydroxy-3-methylbut-2-enyl diphosphate reductase [Thauera humireducens]|uniref:4-hydroxy-3-methylbut-2-enyl diphosphate reductase n=1 Tax=Thauera humireducens TaxID=1134435 RepID=UPI003C72BC37